jgi:phosphopantothenoylcysteine decarboxylase/phosphopantothenate--cysteine ligase
LVTAGPTYEAIDPVRFIGNYSSGLMGYSLAKELANRGANVHLISGPTHLEITHSNIEIVRITSADEMYAETIQKFQSADAAILSAAVADYKIENIANEKIKKSLNTIPELKLIPTPDILTKLGMLKSKKQFLVGFALETNNEIPNAIKKLENKKLDFIVLNSLNDKGAGFGHQTNKVTLIDKNHSIEEFDLKSKKDVATDIVNKLVRLMASE